MAQGAKHTMGGSLKIMDCPACGNAIIAATSAEIGEAAAQPTWENKTVSVDVTLVGIRVDHDCIPRVTR